MEEYVADSVSKGEYMKLTMRYQLFLKRRIYLYPRVLPEDPVEQTLLFHQVWLSKTKQQLRIPSPQIS
jgi:hypothetical protein